LSPVQCAEQGDLRHVVRRDELLVPLLFFREVILADDARLGEVGTLQSRETEEPVDQELEELAHQLVTAVDLDVVSSLQHLSQVTAEPSLLSIKE
jgi:hypothetical protein